MNTSKLWIVGCSIAHGIGVADKQRWGNILSNRLDMPAVFLTAEGASIEWAANQILQADINSNDVVCWGLTTPNRSLWYNECGKEQHILNVYYHNHDFQNTLDRKHLVDLNLAYKAVNYVKQVQNYLNKVGCRYAIGYTLPGLTEHCNILLSNLKTTPNFFVAYDSNKIKATDTQTFFKLAKPQNSMFVDVGDDGFHPGVEQHKLYAKQFLDAVLPHNK